MENVGKKTQDFRLVLVSEVFVCLVSISHKDLFYFKEYKEL